MLEFKGISDLGYACHHRRIATRDTHSLGIAGMLVCTAAALVLSACGTTVKRDTGVERVPKAPARAGFYLDDGPGDNPPANLDRIPDAIPKVEPLHRGASRPYTVMGKNYTPMTVVAPYKARGLASWYGRRYHGKPTSSGEIYDMYGMTAAHTTLPIPSYARVTNVNNGKSVVVRINDRGPFLYERMIDLSYTAAYRLGVLAGGNALVDVETIIPGEAPQVLAASAPGPAQPAPAPYREVASSAASREPDPIATPLPAQSLQASATTSQPPQPALASDGGGIYLQLGAFGSKESAETYLAGVKAQVDWLAQALQVFLKDGLFRVHAGPYASQTEARQAADRIGRSLGFKPMVFTR